MGEDLRQHYTFEGSRCGPDDYAGTVDGVKYELNWSVTPKTPALPQEEKT